MNDAAVAELEDWYAAHLAETERKIETVLATFAAMMAGDANPEAVLRWCREPIAIPQRAPLPHGRVKVCDLKQWALRDAERRIKEADAWLRAYAEKCLAIVDADLQ